jgi:metallophosphoesterase (TIGR00282 family)
MKILFLGDIMGQVGVDAVCHWVPKLKAEQQWDVVIANGENASGGKGIHPQQVEMLLGAGVDVLTGGNHSLHDEHIIPVVHRYPRLLRPINHNHGIGVGHCDVLLENGRKLAVISVEGRVFLKGDKQCPFEATKAVLAQLDPDISAVFVDIHAEATSEKQAFGWFFDGRVSAVVGTHTHVATADARILPQGTAYLTDAGMCGPYHSVIGLDIQTSLARFMSQNSTKSTVPFSLATDDVWLSGAVIEIDDRTGRAQDIQLFRQAYKAAP